MSTSVLERPDTFELNIDGWEKKLNGERTDEKSFEFQGLDIETEIKDEGLTWVSVKILQDGKLLLSQSGNTVNVKFKDEKIEVHYTQRSGGARGHQCLVRGWKYSPDPDDRYSFMRDDQV